MWSARTQSIQVFGRAQGEGDFASLRAGLAYFALRAGAPIVPVAVLGSTGRGGRLVRALPPLRSRVDVVFGEPFDAGGEPEQPEPPADREPSAEPEQGQDEQQENDK